MKKKLTNLSFIVLYSMIFLSLLIFTTINSYRQMQKGKNAFESMQHAKIENKILQFSKTQPNILFIMPDMTSGLDINNNLEDPANQAIRKELSGFTSYANLISGHWGTNGSLPMLYAGHAHNVSEKLFNPQLKDLNFYEYMKKSVGTTIEAFSNANWDVSWLHPMYYKHQDWIGYIGSDIQQFEDDFQKYDAKTIKSIDFAKWYEQKHRVDYEKLNLPNDVYDSDNHKMDIAILDGLSKIKPKNPKDDYKPVYLNVYLSATHDVPVMNEEGNFLLNGKSPYTTREVYDSKKGFLKKLAKIVKNLKDNDIYDNTMIVVVSDHGYQGYSLPLSSSDVKFGYNNGQLLQGLRKVFKFDPKINRLFPTLMVKPFNLNKKKLNSLEINYRDFYSNGDALSFIAHYLRIEKNRHPHNPIFKVNFKTLQDDYLRANIKDFHLQDNIRPIKGRKLYYYGNDSLWLDSLVKYNPPSTSNGHYSSDSYWVKDNIFELRNYLTSNRDDYYYPQYHPHTWEKPGKSSPWSKFRFKEDWKKMMGGRYKFY